jgi:hypothetical protein
MRTTAWDRPRKGVDVVRSEGMDWRAAFGSARSPVSAARASDSFVRRRCFPFIVSDELSYRCLQRLGGRSNGSS